MEFKLSKEIVRPAHENELQALSELLLEEMGNDPFTVWLKPRHVRDGWLKGHFYRILSESYKTGVVLTTDNLLGVAIWVPPENQTKTTLRALFSPLRDFYWYRGRTREVRKGFKWLENARPVEKYWYLQLLATKSEARRQGVGTALIDYQQRLSMTKNDLLVVEITNRKNMFFYAKQGFRIGHTFTLPAGPDVFSLINSK